MRLAIGGFNHETNAFSNVPTTIESFRKYTLLEGEDIIRRNTGIRSYVGGSIDEAKAQGVELVPIMYCVTNPSGLITTETYAFITDTILGGLKKAHEEAPLDGVLLELHGAGHAESSLDPEGDLIRKVRALFGPEMPIGVCLDLHANVSPNMVRYSDILLGVKCYPHTDQYDQGRNILKLIADKIRGGYEVHEALVKLPLIIVPASGSTLKGPAAGVQKLIFKLKDEDPEILDLTFFHSFPYTDVIDAVASVACTARTKEKAERTALQVAEYVWAHREDFAPESLSCAEAFDRALEMLEKTGGKGPDGESLPVIVNESSDNPGSGCPQDGTWLLQEFLKRDMEDTLIASIYDPEVVKQALEAGVGATIRVRLGGKTHPLHGEPVEADAYVKTLSDGRYKSRSPMGLGGQANVGPLVLLKIGSVYVIVVSKRAQIMDDGHMEVAGLDYRKLKIMGVKSAQHFRGFWETRVSGLVACDPPGLQKSDVSVYDRKLLPKDAYPLNKEAVWDGALTFSR